MANVDPFVIQWPRAWTDDPEIGPVVHYLNRFLHDLFIRSGGGDDLIEEAEKLLVGVDSRVSKNTAIIDYLSNREKIVVTTAGLTAYRFDTIICNNTSSINITLDPNAKKGDVINVKRQNAEVIVLGDIDGDTDMVINVQYYSAKLVFNGTDWSRV